MRDSVRTLVVGASGYSGAELLRLLLMHPGADLVGVTSRQHAGSPLCEVFPRFRGALKSKGLVFSTPEIDGIVRSGAEIVFLALPHGLAAAFALPLVDNGLRVIDLSADFRIRDAAVYEAYYGAPHPSPEMLRSAVYGMPEIYGNAIRDAVLVASPGCYPTSVILPLVPLLRAGIVIPESIHVSSMSGVSGAGKGSNPQFLFAECNESVRAYGVPRHRHLSEIEQELAVAAGVPVVISFATHLIPVTAGIHTTTYAALRDGIVVSDVDAAMEAAYGDSPFVRLLGDGQFPDTKNVVGTNFIDIGWVRDPRTHRLVLLSAEDNLGKGAASQAVQSMNLMCGFPEDTGLLNF